MATEIEHGHSPLEQFKIDRLIPIEMGGFDLSLTNSALWMLVAVALATVFITVGASRKSLIPSRWQAFVEMAYEFIANLLRDNVGKQGLNFFPLVFSLFFFILFSNLTGMLPFSFTPTSHIIVTFSLAFAIFLMVTIVGFIRHGFHFLSLFVPQGMPGWLLPLIIPIEILSYFTRPISLSLRLFVNMMAGHTMLKVIAGFVISLGIVGGWAPLLFLTALTGLELLIAFLQAYVFTVLTCIYLNDAINLHHE